MNDPLNDSVSVTPILFPFNPEQFWQSILQIIREEMASALPAKEDAIYDMIALRLLEAISQVCSKEITEIILLALQYDFVTFHKDMEKYAKAIIEAIHFVIVNTPKMEWAS